MGLKRNGFNRIKVIHNTGYHVFDNAHTQNVDKLWLQFMPGMNGVYRDCGYDHAGSYTDEYARRHSNRKSTFPILELSMPNVAK